MKSAIVTSDEQLRAAVVEELDWDPEFDSSEIAVAAEGDTVTLTGFVDNYAAKLASERAAKRVFGVRAVANDINVKLRLKRADSDIAKDAAQALRSRISIPNSVKATVRDGLVTLDGTVDWMYQRTAAESAVKYLRGISGIKNYITINSKVWTADVSLRIQDALRRNAEVDARGIEIQAHEGTVSLHGSVHSWAERAAAERAAASAPGVTKIDSHLVVSNEGPPAIDHS